MQHLLLILRMALVAVLLLTAAPPHASAQNAATPIALDEAGFVLRIVDSPAPVPTQKILTAYANGRPIPVTLDEPAAEPLTLDTNGAAHAAGTLDSQGMASYVVELAAGAVVRAIVTHQEPTRSANSFVLTVVGADGYPLQTDHAGASTFDQSMPASQAYTFKVINFGDAVQDYTFDLAVGDAATGDAELGARLVRQFFDTLMTGDPDQLAAMLAPAFQLLRSSGEVFDAASYPAVAPVYADYVLDHLSITRDGDVLVATYTVQTDTTLDDGVADFSAPAARLTVFQQIDGAWKMVAHANFGAPATGDAGAEAFSLPDAQAVITDADNGDAVQAAAGGKVEVELPGNPTTRVPLADALGTLEPQAVWQHFYDLTQVPRPSHHEEQATAFVTAYGESLGLETIVDAVGNVIIRKTATPGREDRPGVILQAHLDMVPQKTPDSTHDFLTDPIDAYVEDGWVHADGTTLGADDGSGVALIMALLADDALVHPPLEALFTTNEEDGFGGINGLAPDVLQGHYYINIDNEVEGQFLVSSAGGVYVDVTAAYDQETTPDGMTGLQVTLDGLRGGHSGADIDKGRGSAHQLMARLLWNAPTELGVRLESLVGGNQANAIPRTTAVTAAVPEEQVDAFTAYVAAFAATIQHELVATEPNLIVTVAPAELPAQVMAAGAQRALIGAVYGAPQGVIRMSDSVPGLVETSGNMGVLSIGDGQLDATIYVRSAVDSARDDAAARFSSVFELGGATVTVHDAYSGWPANPDSPLLAQMTQTYQDLFGVAPEAVAIHAGLETSVAGVTYPGLDMISIGPTLLDVHSPDERWEVASAAKVYELLVATLQELQ